MLLDVVECHTMQIPSETEGKNGPFRFEFLSNSVKNVDKSWVFMSAVHHRCINFLRSLRILYHLIYYICFAVRIHKHLRPWY